MMNVKLSESEMGFDGVAEFLERVAKNSGNGSTAKGVGGIGVA